MKKQVTILMSSAMLLLAGCSHPTPAGPANEMTFPLSGISHITISYDEEEITFFSSDSDA